MNKNTNTFKNPFLDYNANTYSEEKVLSHWHSPFNTIIDEVSEIDLFEDSMPYFINGHRGSGKTMILKYMSFPCQKLKYNVDNSSDYINKLKSICVYMRLDTSAIMNMYTNDESVNDWKILFVQFFELNVFFALLDLIKVLVEDRIIHDFELKNILDKLSHSFETFYSINDVELFLELLLSEIDDYRSNKYFEENLTFTPTVLLGEKFASFKLVDILVSNVKALSGKKIVFALDEFENYNEVQQSYVLKLVKFCNSSSGTNTNFRIGLRIGGIWGKNTLRDEEFLRENFDYRSLSINQYMGKGKAGLAKYNSFLKKVAESRLKDVAEFNDKGNTDIEIFLLKSEDWEAESRRIVGSERKHLKLIKKEYYNDENIKLISNPDKPLQEIYNILRLNKGESASNIKRSMDDFNNSLSTDLAKKYNSDYINKYRYSAVFLLCSYYKKNKEYYSLNTFSYLSSGSVRTFINLCRETFAFAAYDDLEGLLNGNSISQDIQTRAANKISQIEIEMIKPIKDYGKMLFNLTNALGNEFRRLHQDYEMKYPETNQFAFGYSNGEKVDSIIKRGLVWSVLLQKDRNQQITIGEKKGPIYTINRIYAPYFQISYRTRGGKNLVFYNEHDFFVAALEGKFIETKSASPNNQVDGNPSQLSFFDLEDLYE